MRSFRYRGRVKVVEQTGQWGVYSGERIVLGEGRSFQDDLGIRLRMAFDEASAAALRTGRPLPEAVDLHDVEIVVKIGRRRPRRR